MCGTFQHRILMNMSQSNCKAVYGKNSDNNTHSLCLSNMNRCFSFHMWKEQKIVYILRTKEREENDHAKLNSGGFAAYKNFTNITCASKDCIFNKTVHSYYYEQEKVQHSIWRNKPPPAKYQCPETWVWNCTCTLCISHHCKIYAF